MDTKEQLEVVIGLCRNTFVQKAHDYSASWRVLRPETVTDQIFIKANRIRTLQVKGDARIAEGIFPEFIGIVNYGAMGLIQLERGYADCVDMTADEAVAAYDQQLRRSVALLNAKNHDYDEAWRLMRVSSYVDLILMKINRTKEIEDHGGRTLVSEGVDANYMDMINYSLFGLIKLHFADGVAEG